MKRATIYKDLGLFDLEISIHALVKRATGVTTSQQMIESISIHALVKRATGDRSYSGTKLVISIHALVKRATAVFAITNVP